MRIKLLCRRGIHSNSSIDHSISGIKSAFSRKEVHNVVPSSNTWCLRRSYAAPSVASDVPKPEKDRRSVPIEARRAMVESFVDKHRALNAGKFPSISNIQKEVGGSFYVVRKILQELQNESTMSSLKGRSKKSFQETAIKGNPIVGFKHLEAASDRQKSSCADKSLSAAADVELPIFVSHSSPPMKNNLLEDSEEVISASRMKPDDNVKDLDISEHFCTESHVLKNEQDVVSDVHLESTSSSEELKHEGQNCKEQQVHGSPELDRENIKNKKVDEALVPTSESKSWGGHLQSVVDGLISLWRKL